ncbi:hypothetical protein [Legionella taurinensis]|uniref:Uncharacterized protein n=1 Tax=Legionella taurinensis TaxID=70611 RepID=A0A3A5LBX6_9GAMM|nr:hypothetical protein [Legionella taurinensis]RJT45592.1 hypothetical protein D6J04_10735 [Legionella taurinensis]RJT66208.1 hypothetical protein D6J03_11380 [Legionella taurinensis]STY26264.1 Uncharacterised protein [Legionella taurinensis]
MTVLSLKILAAQSLRNNHPEKLLALYDKAIDPGIEQTYITPQIDALIRKEKSHYEREVEARKDAVKDTTSQVTSSRFFHKVSACTSMTLSTGVHVATYYILGAAEVDADIRMLWLALTPVSTLVGMATGVFCIYPFARGIVGCMTPSVSSERTIDLEQVVRQGR